MNSVNKLLVGGGVYLSIVGFTVVNKNVKELNNKIEFDRIEVIEMKNTIEDILEWQEYNRERGETGMGSYEEGWGSNYWLTEMRNDLYLKLIGGEDRYEVNCENCDEID
jgi:hypothetical protein